jgi:hypothetical protein
MSTPSTNPDFARLADRMLKLEKAVAGLSWPTYAPASLPVDKMQLAEYGPVSATVDRLVEECDEEEEVFSEPNVTRNELDELVSAVRDYLEWSHPQSHLSAQGWEMVAQSAQERLERALRPVERELKRADNA